jgi:beta-glucosidase
MAEILVGDGMFLFSNPIFHLPGSVGNTTSKLFNKGLINVALCDGPAGIRLQKESGLNKRNKIKPIEMPIGFLEFLPWIAHKVIKANPKKDKMLYQYTTSFPVATALAQTWNIELLEEIGLAIQKEMEEYGCTYWLAPAVNIQMNPLCGRNFEYFSEDPFLTGKLASSIIKGIQSKKGFYATVKHFACNNQETNREHVSSNVSERALREIYTKAFKICVKESHVKSVMTSYNKLNNVYTPNSYDLCTKLLRCEWGFDGVVMTDWLSTARKLGDNGLAIEAGNDLIMPGGNYYRKQIKKAIRKGKLSYDDLYRCASNVLKAIKNSDIQKKFDNNELNIVE